MTKLDRLREEIPDDLPDDWDCIIRAGDVRALLDAVEYAQHDWHCGVNAEPISGPCDCGLNQIKAALDREAK